MNVPVNHHLDVSNELATISQSQAASQSMKAIANQPAGLPQINQQLDQIFQALHEIQWNALYDRLHQDVVNRILKIKAAAHRRNRAPGPNDPLSPLPLPLPPRPVAPPLHGPPPVAPPIAYPVPFPASRQVLEGWPHAALDTILGAYGLPVASNLAQKRATLLDYLLG